MKLSMLGYAVPGWTEDATKEALVRQLVLETIERFGAQRCMFASNWHGSGAMSNADLADDCEISMAELYRRFDSYARPLPLRARMRPRRPRRSLPRPVLTVAASTRRTADLHAPRLSPHRFVADLSRVERERLFNGTASEFYRLGQQYVL